MQPITRDSLIVLGVVAAIVLGAVFLVYTPQNKKMQAIEGEIAAEAASLEADGLKAAVVPEMLKQIETMRVRYKDFDRRLPKRKELGGFLREISENLSSESLGNQLIEPGSPTQQELFYTLPIIVRFRGPYLSLARFLEKIDRMERLTCVQKMSVVNDPKDQVLDVTMQLNIYFTES